MKKTGILGKWGRWAASNPSKVFIAAFIITLIMVLGTVFFLEMEMTFYSIMPQSSQRVADLKKITEDFPFSSSIVVIVDGRNIKGPSAKETVSKAVNDMEKAFSGDEYKEMIKGVYGTVDLSYIREHGFMLSKPEDITRFTDIYADANLAGFLNGLNNDLEREYSGDSDALDDDEAQVISWVKGLEAILTAMADTLDGNQVKNSDLDEALNAYLLGDKYYFSRDENMAAFFIQPTYTINDMGPLVKYTLQIEEKVKEIAGSHGISAGLTGLLVVGKDEMVTSEKGFAESMIIAYILILALLITVFRMKSTPLIIGVPLFLGVFWTAGLTGFLIQRLNIMTAMYLVALLGLGVDYAIHMISGYVQERDKGAGSIDAVENSLAKCGRGIVTGALTTAAAFFVLIIAKSEVIRELAVVASVGILAELAAMLMLVPAAIGYRAKRLEKKGKTDSMLGRKIRIKSDFAGKLGKVVTRVPLLFIGGLVAVTVVLAFFAPKIDLEDNLMKMEAKGLESVELQDVMIDEFGAAPDVLYVLSDDSEKLPAMVEKIEDLATVKYVDSINTWLPNESQQKERIPLLTSFRRTLQNWKVDDAVDNADVLEELYRLEFNIIEMGDLAVLGSNERLALNLNRISGLDDDGNKVSNSVFDRLFAMLEDESTDKKALEDFQKRFSPLLAARVAEMANPREISKQDLPEMIVNTFFSDKTPETLVTISPRQNPWEGNSRGKFTAQVATVTDRGTGLILAADEMNRIAEKDGITALVGALVIVFLILFIDFRNLRLTLISFMPLAMSFISLLGIMVLTGIKFDFVNIISIPLLVGIGIDDTVHINHRYLLEGRGSMNTTLAGTGTAVLMTTITTMVGFASFIPSVMRALRSTGVVLTLAMGLAFIFSICFHPSILIIIAEKFNWNLKPAGFLSGKRDNTGKSAR